MKVDIAPRTAGSRYASGRRQYAPRNPSTQSCGTATGRTSIGPSIRRSASIGSKIDRSIVSSSGKYSSTSQNGATSASQVTMTARSRATRRSSARPRARSGQWCTVSTASVASKLPSANGSAVAEACTTGAAPGGRWRIISGEGSTARTRRSVGS